MSGDFSSGKVEFADGQGPTFGLRWSTPFTRRMNVETVVQRAMQDEVGQLAAAEARPATAGSDIWLHATLYEEPAPPGRDVWTAFSPATGRLVQLIYFAKRRDSVLRDRLAPTLVDHPVGRATPWAVFDLNLIAPAEAKLIGHRLNAGDLALLFDGPVGQWSIRQLAPASLAIGRRPLAEWVSTPAPTLGPADRPLVRFYRLAGSNDDPDDFQRAVWRRRRRYFWRRNLRSERIALAKIDSARDRLLILEGSDEPLLREISRTVGTILRSPSSQSL